METWIAILVVSFIILIGYIIFYNFTLKKHLYSLTQKHGVAVPHNNIELLKEFIEDCWSQGYSIPEIKEVLIDKGWDDSLVKNMFYKSDIPREAEDVTRIRRKLMNLTNKTFFKSSKSNKELRELREEFQDLAMQGKYNPREAEKIRKVKEEFEELKRKKRLGY